MRDLSGRVAVVTGGASGIGWAVARRAGAAGMKVVLADIEGDPLERATRELEATGTETLGVHCDVSDAESVDALRDAAVARFGAVHLVHNNAGVGAGGPLWELPLTDWHWVLGVNLYGVVHGIRSFVPLMLAQGEGHVVNTASLAGLVSTPLMGPYNASKHAVVTISETLLKDLRMAGGAGASVGVSVLCPAFVRTGIARSERNRPSWAPAAGSESSGAVAGIIGQLVDGGIDPDEVGAAVIDAVQENRFYILTHPESYPAVRRRMNDIVEGRTPSDLPLA
ncbi:MAG: SDR family NAD(P)-dependent oxidoreductase [Acidimicrobiales bacterium]